MRYFQNNNFGHACYLDEINGYAPMGADMGIMLIPPDRPLRFYWEDKLLKSHGELYETGYNERLEL